jgi:DnaJ-class molecular chaperone
VNWIITYRPGYEDSPRQYPPAECVSCEGSGLRRDRPAPGPPRSIPVLEWIATNCCPHCKGTGDQPVAVSEEET